MNNKTIVIIDDEEDILFTLSEICAFSGFKSFTASNGIEGFERCKELHPNLVIVDYHMPGWDGLTTVKKIKSLDPTTSILVLTVDERQEIADRFIAVGATDFAIKPIKAPDLIARININLKINEVEEKLFRERENMFVDKGISPATLSLILQYFEETDSESVTIDDVIESVSLAYQTVHRYIRHLVEIEKLEVIPEYGQKGRPKNRYRLL